MKVGTPSACVRGLEVGKLCAVLCFGGSRAHRVEDFPACLGSATTMLVEEERLKGACGFLREDMDPADVVSAARSFWRPEGDPEAQKLNANP